MWVTDQMCWIHIWYSFQLHPTFKPRQGLNAKGTWKTNWYEETGLHPFTPRNQFVLWTKSTKTMCEGAEMPTRWLCQEHLNNNSLSWKICKSYDSCATEKMRLEYIQWNYILSWKRTIGYDVGYTKDEYGCNSFKCECAHFDQTVIGKLNFHKPHFYLVFRRHCGI